MKSILNIAAMSQRFLEHGARVLSLVLPVVRTSTTAMLSQETFWFDPYLGSYHNVEYL